MKRNLFPHGHGLALLIAFSLALAHPASAQNPELAAIHEADQAARSDPASIDWTVLGNEDGKRRERVMQLLREGAVQTATDYHHAAMVFQHGSALDDIRLAHALATLAMSLEPAVERHRWLVAASWDRMMTHQLQPQWYGTQFRGQQEGMFLYPVAEGAVTDEDRQAMHVPTLAEARARLDEMARMHGQRVHPHPPTIEQLRKAQLPSGDEPHLRPDATTPN